MSSQQPSGDSKTLIIDSQQPPADSKTIDISMKNVQMSSQQLSDDSNTLIVDSKTIHISITKRANIITAAFWRFQHINS